MEPWKTFDRVDSSSAVDWKVGVRDVRRTRLVDGVRPSVLFACKSVEFDCTRIVIRIVIVRIEQIRWDIKGHLSIVLPSLSLTKSAS